MRKLGPIVVGIVLGSVVACDGGAPPDRDPPLTATPEQAAAPGTAADETAAADEAQSTPEPYDTLNELRLGVEQAYLDELIEALELQRAPQRPPVPPGLLQQFERGLPLRENWMNCTRYLTNNPAAGFCEDEPPANWAPFIFNEQRFFLVPIGPAA